MFWGSGGSLGSSYQKWKAQSCINRKLWAMVEIFYPKLWETCTGPCLSLSEYRVVLFLVSCSGKERGCRVQDLSSYTIVIIILKCTHSLHFFLPEMTCLFTTRQLCSVRKLRCQSALWALVPPKGSSSSESAAAFLHTGRTDSLLRALSKPSPCAASFSSMKPAGGWYARFSFCLQGCAGWEQRSQVTTETLVPPAWHKSPALPLDPPQMICGSFNDLLEPQPCPPS